MFGWVIGSMLAVTGLAVAASITIYLNSTFGGGVSNATSGCDSSISFDFTTPSYDAAAAAYVFTDIDYAGLDVPNCDTQTLRLTVVNSSSTALANGSLLIDDTSPNQSPGSVTPSAGTITLSQPVSVTDADRVVAAITNN